MPTQGKIEDHSCVAVVRASIVALAVLVCAWFALAARAAHDTARVTAIVSAPGRLTAAQAAHARSLLDAASTLNPDSSVDLLRAQVALERHQNGAAVRMILNVTDREPMNLQAWVALARATLNRNPSLLELAVHHIGRLAPQVK